MKESGWRSPDQGDKKGNRKGCKGENKSGNRRVNKRKRERHSVSEERPRAEAAEGREGRGIKKGERRLKREGGQRRSDDLIDSFELSQKSCWHH